MPCASEPFCTLSCCRQPRAASRCADALYDAKCTDTPPYRQNTCAFSSAGSFGPPGSVLVTQPPASASHGAAIALRSPPNLALLIAAWAASYGASDAPADGFVSGVV